MRMISCGHCGVMLDTDRITEPDIYFDESAGENEGCVDPTKAFWDGDSYDAKIPCPVCKTEIAYQNGDTV